VLLLVLIFVLVAFGLLLVALVTGTAAWAWVSVVVSVAAAGALVYDWAQRRAAVKSSVANRAPRGQFSAPTNLAEPPTTAIPALGHAVTDPPTEVFAAIRPSSGVGPPVADAPETVAIPAVSSPPGSPDRPSSAVPDGRRSGDQQSPSVTTESGDRTNVPNSAAASLTGDKAEEKATSESGKTGDRGIALAAGAAGAVVAGAAAARSNTTGPPRADEPKDARPAGGERPTDTTEQRSGGPAEPDRGGKPAEPARSTEPARSGEPARAEGRPDQRPDGAPDSRPDSGASEGWPRGRTSANRNEGSRVDASRGDANRDPNRGDPNRGDASRPDATSIRQDHDCASKVERICLDHQLPVQLPARARRRPMNARKLRNGETALAMAVAPVCPTGPARGDYLSHG